MVMTEAATQREALKTLHTLATARDHEIDLGLTLLWLSRMEYPHIGIEDYLRRIDVLAGQFAARLTPAHTAHERVVELTTYMSTECGFRGNSDDYYDPRNSFLSDVIDRYMGIPITLAAIYMEVGKRAGMQLAGVSFPFHFLVVSRDADDTFIDAFHGGRIMHTDGCRDLLAHITDGRLPFKTAFLEPVTTREMLVRTFRNLKNVYARNIDLGRAIRMSGLILSWEPNETIEYRDRGLMRLQRKDVSGGIDDLEEYIVRSPQAPDLDMVLTHLQKAHQTRRTMN